MFDNIKIPVWLISFAGIVFIIVILERIYISKADVNVIGIHFPQPEKFKGSDFIVSGNTSKERTVWDKYPDGRNGVFTTVNTASHNFSNTPHYIASLHGNGRMWQAVGVSSIYDATKNSFRVYLQDINGGDLTPTFASENKWFIVWHAIGNEQNQADIK